MKVTVKALKVLATLLMLVILFLSIAPFFVSVYSFGSFVPIVLFGSILLVWYVPNLKEKIKSVAVGKILYRILSVVILIGLCYSTVVAGLIFTAGNNKPENPEDTTLIVLGCQVFGTRPSLMLVTRLKAAQAFLEENPQTSCILSGGKGPGEDISEAEAMKNYLVSRGIAEERLYLEGNSFSTIENFAYSKELMEQQHLSEQVVVTTNEFHLYRSGLIAKSIGLESYSNPAKTPWHLFLCYLVREIFAVTYFYVFG